MLSRHGKSKTAHAIKRLMDDLNNRPIEDMVLSHGKVHGARYYCVEPIGGNWLDMETWCLNTLGPSGSVWDLNDETVRWIANNRKFWFRHETDRTMFILKWL